MALFYAKSTNGFYSSEINGDAIPDDAVAITEAEHAALMQAQQNGQKIVGDDNGNPITIEQPPLSGNALILSQIAALEATQTLRRMRDTSPAGIAWLAALEIEMVALRKQLTA